MSKNRFPTRIDPINLPRRLREGLDEAESLLEDGDAQKALELLTELDGKFPRQVDVLGLMANAQLELGNQRGYLHALYQLHELTPNRADVKLGLAGAYFTNNLMGLALRTFRQFLKQWPRDERAADVQKTIAVLELGLTESLEKLDFTLETGLDFSCRHEELQLLMELGHHERCKRLAKDLLAQRPHFVPTLNNLCQIHWLEGELAVAIETARKVLEIEPDNVHALANLARFLYMQGNKAEALAFAGRLKKSKAEAADGWTKRAEALSFICDDEAVLALPDQAKRAGEADQLHGVVWHWCAVAEYRRGNIAKARADWQKSLKLAPYFLLSALNLEELKKPAYERVCPQAFTMDEWLPKKIFENLLLVLKRSAGKKDDQRFQQDVSAYMDAHPEILQFVSDALLWGDAPSRELALNFVDMSAHPGLLEILKGFTLGQAGPDAERLEGLQHLTKYGVFETGEMVELWREGKPTQVLTLGFQISYDSPDKPQLRPGVLRLMEQAMNALHSADGSKAEGLLRKALEIQPEEPSLLNNLAASLQMQKKMAEANLLADTIAEKFPNYFFGQVIAVRRALQAGDLERAQTIIDRMMKKKELHVTEFGALCGCQIDLLIADEKPEGAVSWFGMWEQGYPEDPALEHYRDRMAMIENFLKFKTRLPRRTWAKKAGK